MASKWWKREKQRGESIGSLNHLDVTLIGGGGATTVASAVVSALVWSETPIAQWS